VLKAGQYTKVAPGESHQFEAVTDCIAFELYWAEFDHNDIERETVGFTK
jgi:quercetin dioxygenase-like cupin family protein